MLKYESCNCLNCSKCGQPLLHLVLFMTLQFSMGHVMLNSHNCSRFKNEHFMWHVCMRCRQYPQNSLLVCSLCNFVSFTCPRLVVT
jgi:hypothetical protein